MTLYQWAARWHIPIDALADLQRSVFGMDGTDVTEPVRGHSEASVQSIVRLEAASKGVKLFRNNVGAATTDDGSFIRFGLANDSKKINEIIKSGDLIGIRKVLVTPAHVGSIIGQFVSREIKRYGWRYSADPREVAQLRWAEMIQAYGGDAAFATGEGSL